MKTWDFVKKGLLPLLAFFLIAILGQYIYIVDGQIDWFRAMLVFGLPFGISQMVFIFPIGGSVSGNVALLVLNAVIGALFGCVIAAFIGMRALIYLVWFPVERIGRLVVR